MSRANTKIADSSGHRATLSSALALRRLAARVRKRGPGASVTAALIGGDAEARADWVRQFADALRRDVWRVDLSTVAGRYIGETEKNLARTFDMADGTGVILFFDEADALFGKRSDVRDSHDRYANIETNYLLHRMERFDGIALLAANRRTSLRPAFLRRFGLVVPVGD